MNQNKQHYQTIQVCVLMRSLWEVMSGQRCYPLTHLLLNQQHLHLQETHTVLYCLSLLLSFFFTNTKTFNYLARAHIMLHYCNTFNSSHLLCCNLFVSLLVRIKICQPTSVALPWLSACSVKLQLLWMCSFPWRRDES